jgi:hypothetical protein
MRALIVKTTPAARREYAVICRSRDFGFAIPVHWCVVRAMRRVNTRVSVRKRPRFAATRLLMLVTLLAFAVQTYLTQTHIHLANEGQIPRVHGQLVLGKASIGAPLERRDRYPANEDPANCPLCQELIHAGQFVTPVASVLLLPTLPPTVIERAVQYAPLIHAITHMWRGRAPPLG